MKGNTDKILKRLDGDCRDYASSLLDVLYAAQRFFDGEIDRCRKEKEDYVFDFPRFAAFSRSLDYFSTVLAYASNLRFYGCPDRPKTPETAA